MSIIKLSAIIIAKNEEHNIGRCIKSLQNNFEEVVVIIDNNTTDNTENIVKSFPNTKYIIQEWLGYSETKRLAISITSNDWILWIDADENLTPELDEEITRFRNSEPEHAAYKVSRRAFFLDKWIKHSGWYPGRVTRLFNKQLADFNTNTVHENLIVNGTEGLLKHDLEHHTDPNIHHYFEKFNKYTLLAAKELNKKGKKAGLSDLIIRPAFQFFKMFVMRLGILDGIHGFILAVFSSAYVFTKYAKLWELNRKTSK